MVILRFFLFFLFISTSMASELVSISINPNRPLVEEIFDVTFKIKVNSTNKTPKISFNAKGAKVVGKKRGGESIRTVIINGKVTTTKELIFVFKLMAQKAGMVSIQDINVLTEGKRISVPSKTIQVVRARKENKNDGDIFVLAITSKKNLFVGEGIDVNYYLYSNVRMTGYDIEQYPKLNGFIKRFYPPKQNIERVEFNGKIYERSLQYSTRLFPEKQGSVQIDPLILKVQYFSNKTRNPYFSFGFSTGRVKTKIIKSKTININVNPIPSENRPKNFTGLVGDHKFKISLNKRKFLVNEAIELKIEVEGKGALENYDAPLIYQNDNLEEFDQKSRIIHLNTILAKKVFDYTFLPRGPFKIASQEVKFYFFDPSTKKFKASTLSIPELTVGGTAISPSSSLAQKDMEEDIDNSTLLSKTKKSTSLIAPIFKGSITDKILIPKLNIIIMVIIILLMSEFAFSYYKRQKNKEGLGSLFLSIKKDGLNYSKLHKIIITLKSSKDHSYDISLPSIIDKSSLSKEAKIYFKNLINKSEKATFKDQSNSKNFLYKDSFFEELKTHSKKRV